jgi:intracellular sulfur oxidation DsrE/DsrF family protein
VGELLRLLLQPLLFRLPVAEHIRIGLVTAYSLSGKHRTFLDAVSARGVGEALNNSSDRRDEAFDALIKLGVHFAVCDKSTQGLAGSLARKTEGKSDAVYKELLANVIGSSHMVPSGIVAVGHAQEHGYAYAYCG